MGAERAGGHEGNRKRSTRSFNRPPRPARIRFHVVGHAGIDDPFRLFGGVDDDYSIAHDIAAINAGNGEFPAGGRANFPTDARADLHTWIYGGSRGIGQSASQPTLVNRCGGPGGEARYSP